MKTQKILNPMFLILILTGCLKLESKFGENAANKEELSSYPPAQLDDLKLREEPSLNISSSPSVDSNFSSAEVVTQETPIETELQETGFEDVFTEETGAEQKASDEVTTDEDKATQDTPITCAAPRYYSYTIPTNLPLKCDSYVDVLNVNVPDTGRAVAILTGTVHNSQKAGKSYAIHSWSAYNKIGGGDSLLSSGSGESICGQQTGKVQLMSYGELSANSNNLSVKMLQYVSTGCRNGALKLLAGATVHVWVEDPRAECIGKNIVAKSYFKSVWDISGAGSQRITYPQTYAVPVLKSSMDIKKGKLVRVYSQVQSSVDSTENTCGGQYETAGAILQANGAYSGSTSYSNVLPVSGGITHGLYYPSLSFTPTTDGQANFILSAYVDQTKNGGGYAKVGENYSGDSMIVVIQE